MLTAHYLLLTAEAASPARAPSARPRRCLEVELVELVERGTHSSLSLFCAIDILFANGCTARRVVLPQRVLYNTLVPYGLRPSRRSVVGQQQLL